MLAGMSRSQQQSINPLQLTKRDSRWTKMLAKKHNLFNTSEGATAGSETVHWSRVLAFRVEWCYSGIVGSFQLSAPVTKSWKWERVFRLCFGYVWPTITILLPILPQYMSQTASHKKPCKIAWLCPLYTSLIHVFPYSYISVELWD